MMNRGIFKSNFLLVSFALLSGLSYTPVFPQDPDSLPRLPVNLSLENVVNLATSQSSSSRNAQNRGVNYYWSWKNFQTRFRPQLVLNGDLPQYTNTTVANRQDDGRIEFQHIHEFETSATLSLNQSIPQLGTNIYASTRMIRLQDFIQDTINYSGRPFSVGFSQPIFAYNWMKWARKTQPLLYEESQKQYVESMEDISRTATRRFFSYLKVKTNYNLAKSSLANAEDNLKIAETRIRLGQISENDFSRIKLSVLSARKALNQSRMDLRIADFELKSYISLDQQTLIDLEMPLDVVFFDIDPNFALEQAIANRPETPQFERRLIQAEEDLVQARKSTGLNATLEGSYGMSQTARYFYGIYENPGKAQTMELSVRIPILDWGRSASQVKLAESKKELVLYDVEKDKIDFEREVVVQVEQFSLLKDQLATSHEADNVAENGYQIAQKKFQNGEITITDLNISLAERESAKRDYIRSLEDYWIAYYNLRILTLYDFVLNEKIWYDNPMLEGEELR